MNSNNQFYRSLLLALNENETRREFHAKPSIWGKKFGDLVDKANELELSIEARIDPMFGLFPEAEEMIHKGIADLLISTDNNNNVYLRLNPKQATGKLNKIPYSDKYRELAKYFWENF